MHLQIIIGSIRQGRKAKPVGDWVYRIAVSRNDLSAELVDLKNWNLPMFELSKPPILGGYEDALQQRWADKIGEADGYLFVSPEYNHGYSSVQKMRLTTFTANGCASRRAS